MLGPRPGPVPGALGPLRCPGAPGRPPVPPGAPGGLVRRRPGGGGIGRPEGESGRGGGGIALPVDESGWPASGDCCGAGDGARAGPASGGAAAGACDAAAAGACSCAAGLGRGGAGGRCAAPGGGAVGRAGGRAGTGGRAAGRVSESSLAGRLTKSRWPGAASWVPMGASAASSRCAAASLLGVAAGARPAPTTLETVVGSGSGAAAGAGGVAVADSGTSVAAGASGVADASSAASFAGELLRGAAVGAEPATVSPVGGSGATAATFAGADAGASGCSSGCFSRFRPSRSAFRRTRSPCASSIDDEWLFTPIPRSMHRSSASLFVRPSSRASS